MAVHAQSVRQLNSGLRHTVFAFGRMQSLVSKTAVVSGGATLIGQAVVHALHEAGADVVLADINESADSCFVHNDVTVDESIADCLTFTREKFGGVDILVNLACTYVDDDMFSISP